MKWHTIKEASVVLGLCVASVRVLLATGDLGCRRIGPKRGRIQISDEHVAAYLERAERGGYVQHPKKVARLRKAWLETPERLVHLEG